MKPEDYEELFWYYRAMLEDMSDEKFESGKEKYGDAWEDTDPEYLYRRFEEEQMEFRQAVEHYRDQREAMKEMGDMVNFGIMYLIKEMEDGN